MYVASNLRSGSQHFGRHDRLCYNQIRVITRTDCNRMRSVCLHFIFVTAANWQRQKDEIAGDVRRDGAVHQNEFGC